MLIVEKIKFPVIALQKPGDIGTYKDIDDLTKCYNKALKKGYFKNLILIDSNGMLYKIVDAKRVGTIGMFWGHDFLLNQTIRIELIFDEASQSLDLKMMKDKIVDTLNEDKDFWSSGGNFNEIKRRINNGNSFKEVINTIHDILYTNY